VAIKAKKVQHKFYDKVLGLDEIKELIRAAKYTRDKLMIELFYLTGIRVSELIQIKWSDFRKYKESYIIYIKGKGSKIRPVKITNEFYQRLSELKIETSEFVFYSRINHNKPIGRTFVTKKIKELGKKIGLRTEISAHALRHTHATHCIEKGVPIQVLKDSLGHTSITTTEKYLHANPDVFSGDTLEL
jgi:integrase/recombinase XerD